MAFGGFKSDTCRALELIQRGKDDDIYMTIVEMESYKQPVYAFQILQAFVEENPADYFALEELASYYENGMGVEKDIEKAARLYRAGSSLVITGRRDCKVKADEAAKSPIPSITALEMPMTLKMRPADFAARIQIMIFLKFFQRCKYRLVADMRSAEIAGGRIPGVYK